MNARNYMWDDLPVPRPATGKTANRNLRAPAEEWLPAMKRVRDEGWTMTSVLRAVLREIPSLPPRSLNEVWLRASAKAHTEGRSLAGVLTDFLREYISTPPRPREGDDD